MYGETGLMRVNGTAGGAQSNDTFNSIYDFAGERFWQIRHDYDFAALGIPGQRMMNRYISGDNIHTSVSSDGRKWGRESRLTYVIQSDPLKNRSLRWRNSSLRRDFSKYDIDENRLILNDPIRFL
jgi:hypothetical protein